MRDQHDVEVEKQRTIQEIIKCIFWLGFWFLVIGGCIADQVINN